MKKNLLIALAFVATGIFSASAQTKLFESDESTSLPYRIPAIVQTSNNDVLVFADERHGGGDVGQLDNTEIDIVYKRFSNGSWGGRTLVKDGNEDFGYGDVAVVADRENPAEIVFFTAAGNIFYTSSTQSSPLRCYRFHSSDGGVTWDKDASTNEVGTDVTSHIYGLDTNCSGFFFSSGRICQSSRIKVGTHYRLYAALCARKNGGDNSLVIYSDDFGKEWKILGTGPAVSGGNEAKCEELSNGDVLVSARAAGTRYFNVFSYTDEKNAKGSWEDTHSSGIEMAKYSSNATNGEILIVKAVDSDGTLCDIALQSVPYGSEGKSIFGFVAKNDDRTNVSIYWKKLPTGDITAGEFSSGWKRYPVSTTTSAYSSMIQLTDGTIGFVYEEDYVGIGKGGYNIKYLNLNIEDITEDTYKNPTYSVMLNECTVDDESKALATFSAPVSTTCPEGVTAYYIKAMNNGYAKLEAVEDGKTIPADAGVMLMADAAGSYTMTGASNFANAALTDNMLVGSSNGTVTFGGGVEGYILKGDGQGGVAFYKATGTLGKNKAYLNLNGAELSAGVRITIDGTTAIEDVVEVQGAEDVIYDLYGRRVSEMLPGNIYIVGGKKVLK